MIRYPSSRATGIACHFNKDGTELCFLQAYFIKIYSHRSRSPADRLASASACPYMSHVDNIISLNGNLYLLHTHRMAINRPSALITLLEPWLFCEVFDQWYHSC